MIFRLFRRREQPGRKFVREEFEKTVTDLRGADPLTQAAVGNAINQTNSFFHHRFGSAAKFSALPTDEKMAYVATLTKMEEKAAEKNAPEAMIGIGLFKKWVRAIALNDEELAKEFFDGLADFSRAGDFLLGPLNPTPLPAGFEKMTEEQRKLSMRFIQEHKQRELRSTATEAAKALTEAQQADERGDYPTALRLLQPLADNGSVAAQLNLGLLYAKGQDQKAYDSAHAMYRSAAKNGIRLLLKPQYLGECMQPDFVLAYKWLTLAAADLTDEKRDFAIRYRDQLAAKLTQAQLAEAQTQVREWKTSRKAP